MGVGREPEEEGDGRKGGVGRGWKGGVRSGNWEGVGREVRERE